MTSITSFTPTEIISLHQGQPVTTSLDVAERFGKRHDTVLRALRNLGKVRISGEILLG